jgi:hypothetical protein
LVDSCLAQDIHGTNTGKLKELRCIDCTTRNDYFSLRSNCVLFTARNESNTRGYSLATTLLRRPVDLLNESVGQNGQVFASSVGKEVSWCRITARGVTRVYVGWLL